MHTRDGVGRRRQFLEFTSVGSSMEEIGCIVSQDFKSVRSSGDKLVLFLGLGGGKKSPEPEVEEKAVLAVTNFESMSIESSEGWKTWRSIMIFETISRSEIGASWLQELELEAQKLGSFLLRAMLGQLSFSSATSR
ncbi:hypothetical protein Tco_0739220 [Tanacetum coccineum]